MVETGCLKCGGGVSALAPSLPRSGAGEDGFKGVSQDEQVLQVLQVLPCLSLAAQTCFKIFVVLRRTA